MNEHKRLTAFQKDILRIAKEKGIVNPDIVSEQYDETYWTIKMNLYKLEGHGLLRRVNETRLEFVSANSIS